MYCQHKLQMAFAEYTIHWNLVSTCYFIFSDFDCCDNSDFWAVLLLLCSLSSSTSCSNDFLVDHEFKKNVLFPEWKSSEPPPPKKKKLELRVETDNFLMIFAENFPTRSSVLVKVGCINLNCSQQQQLDNSFARENAMKIWWLDWMIYFWLNLRLC